MSRGAEAGEKIQSLCEAILAEVSLLPSELVRWKPAPEVWSVMDNLCHIEEFVPYWTAQTVEVVNHPDREWGRNHSHAGRLAAVENTAARNLTEVDKNIRALALRSAETLGSLSDADLAREAPSKNPRWGMKPAGFIVEDLLVGHLEKHLGQIRRNVAQYPKNSITT
jgi:hypothetical protein